MMQMIAVVAVALSVACGGVAEDQSPSRAARAPDWCVEECRSSGADEAVCCNEEWAYDDCACACATRDCGEEEE